MILRRKFFAMALVVGVLFMTVSAVAGAEARFLLARQGFAADGTLKQGIVADFDSSGGKNIFAETKNLSQDRAALVLAVTGNTGDAWALQLVDSVSYVFYKTRLRDEVHEELVVMGLGREHGTTVTIKELAVIGTDDNGTVGLLPLQGFVPVDILNAPLQQNTQRQVLLPLSDGRGLAAAKLFWEPSKNAFRFDLPEK